MKAHTTEEVIELHDQYVHDAFIFNGILTFEDWLREREAKLPADPNEPVKDQLIWVKDWMKRHFSHFLKYSRKAVTFNDGWTSTQTNDASTWNYYSLTDPNLEHTT